MPLQPRHGYAAGIHRGLPASDINQPRSSPHQDAGARCNPAQICQIRAGGFVLRGFQPPVSHVHLPVSLAGPRPSGSAGPFPSLSGLLSTLPGVPRIRLPPASTARCDELQAVSFHHRTVQSASWRSKSPTHKRSGAVAVKSRLTRSGRFGAPGAGIVVRHGFPRRFAPQIPF